MCWKSFIVIFNIKLLTFNRSYINYIHLFKHNQQNAFKSLRKTAYLIFIAIIFIAIDLFNILHIIAII